MKNSRCVMCGGEEYKKLLYYDFEHSSNPNLSKGLVKEEELVCIMDETCPWYN